MQKRRATLCCLNATFVKNMERVLVFILLSFFTSSLFAQKVDSIYFHLYTDSLKKGQHNYINVDGRLSNGRWVPMTSKDIALSCAEASFEGNELIIPFDFKKVKVTVKAVLRSNPSMFIEKTIWVKQQPDPPLKKRGSNY